MPDTIETAEHRLTVLADMERTFESIFADLEAAQREIAVNCYIVLDDKLGTALAERLASAVRRGVRARLMYDPLGSKEAPRRFFKKLAATGVAVRAWRKLNSIPALRHIAPRDHSRIFLADRVAYTGGAAFSDCWLPRPRGGAGWHDVCCRVEGPVVQDFHRLFDQRWDEANPDAHPPDDYDTKDRHPDVRLIADTPDRQSPLFNLHCEAFARARRRIWIENAYFVPPPAMQSILCDAARRGVDVRVVLPAVSDLAALKHAALAEAPGWLESGIRMFEYLPSMLHSKTSLVDDDWASVGTFNFNSTSVGLANEVNLVVRDRAFTSALAAHLAEDMEQCAEVTRASLARRPSLARALDAGAHAFITACDLLWGPRRPSRERVLPRGAQRRHINAAPQAVLR